MDNLGVRYDLTIAQGSYFELMFTWKGSDGTPINNTGYTFRFQAKKPGASTLLIDLNQISGVELGGVTGTVRIYMDDEATAALDFTTLPYSLEYDTPSGRSKRLLYGFITLSKDLYP